MIRVIKPAKTEYRCTCPICRAILEFRDEDVEWEVGLYNHHEIITCPECHSTIYRIDYYGVDCWEKIKYD